MRTLLLLRSFLIQGSWNYRVMMGGGLAWALLPVLRTKGRERSAEALARQLEHFNGHPYLMPLALGALARAELAGTDPERIRRFRRVLPAPLGSLGDSLVWVAWRPMCLVGALLAAALGAGPGWIVVGFLVAYNLGHMALRIWAVRAGWAEGVEVGRILAVAQIPAWTERIGSLGVLFLGLLMGVLLVEGVRALGWGLLWPAFAAIFFLVGLRGGSPLSRGGPLFLLILVLSGLFLVRL